MEEQWRQRASAVETLCRVHGLKGLLVRELLFAFLDDFPRLLAAASLSGEALLFRCQPWAGRLLAGDPVPLTHPAGCAVHSVAVVAVGGARAVATGCADGAVRLFSACGRVLAHLQAYPHGPVYSVQMEELPEQGALLCATSTGGLVVRDGDAGPLDAYAHVWRAQLGGTLAFLPVAGCKHRFGVNGVALDARRRLVATASDDRTAGLFDFEGRQLASCDQHGSFVWEVAMDGERELIATACEDGGARLFDFRGRCLARFQCGAGCCEILLAAPSELLIGTSADGTLRLWGLRSLCEVAVARHDSEVHGAAGVLHHGRLVSSTLSGDLLEWELVGKAPDLELRLCGARRASAAAAVTVALG